MAASRLSAHACHNRSAADPRAGSFGTGRCPDDARPGGLVVIQVAQRATLRARPLNANRMIQENVHLPLFQFQFHAFDIPGIGDPENLGTKLSVLNGCSPLGASPLQLHSAWAEDKAMLGSNPSADSGTKTEAGCECGTPFHYPSLRIGTKAINPGGLGAGPQNHHPLSRMLKKADFR
jgi:hypothetical protein